MNTNEIVTIVISIVSAIGVVGGIVGKYLGRMLSNRTQEALDRYRLEQLEKRMSRIEEDLMEDRRNH